MTLLAFLRHGETAWSGEGRIQGHTDTTLSDAGRARLQALRLPPEWEGTACWSSPLRRCRETATALALPPPAIEPRLAEMRWGRWEGQSLRLLRETLGEAMVQNEARGFDFRPEGGESPREVLARVRPWLAEVAAGGRPALAISHRGVIRAVFACATGWDMVSKRPARLDWNALQVFRLDAEGVPRVAQLNLPLLPREPGGALP